MERRLISTVMSCHGILSMDIFRHDPALGIFSFSRNLDFNKAVKTPTNVPVAEWRKKNWGCPFNPMITSVIDYNAIQFETVDNAPLNAVLAISKMYPDKEIKLLSHDVDAIDARCQWIVTNGEVISQEGSLELLPSREEENEEEPEL